MGSKSSRLTAADYAALASAGVAVIGLGLFSLVFVPAAIVCNVVEEIQIRRHP